MTVDAGFSLRARKQVKDHLKTSDYNTFNLFADENYSKLPFVFLNLASLRFALGPLVTLRQCRCSSTLTWFASLSLLAICQPPPCF